MYLTNTIFSFKRLETPQTRWMFVKCLQRCKSIERTGNIADNIPLLPLLYRNVNNNIYDNDGLDQGWATQSN